MAGAVYNILSRKERRSEYVWHDSEDIERLYYHASHYERQNAINYLEQTIAAQGAPAPLTNLMTGEP